MPPGLVLDLDEAFRVLEALEDARLALREIGAAPGLQDELATAGLDGSAQFRKVMMTEISWTTPRAFEITNFGQAAVSLTDWRIKWRWAASNFVSDPINLSIAPN